jgi:hypothetical protein
VVDVEHQHGHAGDGAGGHVQPSGEEQRNHGMLHRPAGTLGQKRFVMPLAN